MFTFINCPVVKTRNCRSTIKNNFFPSLYWTKLYFFQNVSHQSIFQLKSPQKVVPGRDCFSDLGERVKLKQSPHFQNSPGFKRAIQWPGAGFSGENDLFILRDFGFFYTYIATYQFSFFLACAILFFSNGMAKAEKLSPNS